MSAWNEDNIARLKALWEGGEMSTRQIGLELNMSKNAIIGKAARLGLPRKKEASGNRYPTSGKPKPRSAPRIPPSAPVLFRAPKMEQPTLTLVQDAPGVTLLELEPRHCRALVGHAENGAALYCGTPKRQARDASGYGLIGADGSPVYRGSFCECHARMYYRAEARRA